VRVFFHLSRAHEVFRDREGIEVADLEEARVQAISAIEEIRNEDHDATRGWSGWTLTIADESGEILLSITLDGDGG
jgi:hypothetical protein